MRTQLHFLTMLAMSALAAAACNSDSPAKIPPPAPTPGGMTGSIIGTVDGSTNTVSFVNVGASASYSGSVAPAIYGNQGSTVSVFGVIDSITTVPGVSKSWYIRIAMRNLEPYPIGSNYWADPAPDTVGVYLFFYSPPVVTSPAGCACTVSVVNPFGTHPFNAPSQKYFWYQSRPSAMQASPGTDTTVNNPEWKFTATSDSVTGFSFVLMVETDWPSPYDVSWDGEWDAADDSLPDDQATPRWKEFPVAGDAKLGIDTLRGTEMALIAPDSNSSIYMSRHDSAGGLSAVLNVVVRDSSSSQQYQAIFGIVEPTGLPAQGGSGGRQAFVGVAGDRVEFINFTEGDGTWAVNGSACTTGGCATPMSNHTYSLRKFARDSVVLCVDGVRKLRRTYNTQLQVTQPSFAATTMVIGTRSSTNTNKTGYWTSLNYLIGVGAPGSIVLAGNVCN